MYVIFFLFCFISVATVITKNLEKQTNSIEFIFHSEDTNTNYYYFSYDL